MKKFYKNKITSMSLFSFLSIFMLAITITPTTSSAIDFDVPTANAGPDQTITLPTSQVTLSGSSTGVSGIIIYYSWTRLSGSGNIVSPTSATTDVTGLTGGVSVFRLTVTNNTGTTVTDDVNIFVNGMIGGGGGTGGATAYAGPDQTLRPLTTQTTLSGSTTGISGFVIYYSWTKLSGSGNIVSPTSATTDVTGLDVGSATFRFTATNNTGETAYDDVNIVVLPAGPNPSNMPPTAYAGPDQILTSPVSSTILSGSGVDSDGNIVSYHWTKISGSGVISTGTGSSNGSVVSVNGLTVGTSVFRLTVTDNLGDIGIDDMTVVVNSAGTGGGGTGGGGTGGSGGGTGGGTGGSGGGGSGILCPFGVTGTPATCVLISIPKTGVKKTSGLVVIKDFQRFLNWSLGNKVVPLVVDGRWGAKTTAVIKLYQRLNGLKVDGSFGKLSAGKAITILKNANLYKQ